MDVHLVNVYTVKPENFSGEKFQWLVPRGLLVACKFLVGWQREAILGNLSACSIFTTTFGMPSVLFLKSVFSASPSHGHYKITE